MRTEQLLADHFPYHEPSMGDTSCTCREEFPGDFGIRNWAKHVAEVLAESKIAEVVYGYPAESGPNPGAEPLERST